VFVFEENREFSSQLWRECREREVIVNIDNIVRMRSIDSLRRLRAVNCLIYVSLIYFEESADRILRLSFHIVGEKNHFSLDSYLTSMYIFAGK